MAERRMFAKTIIDSDVFLDMPLSAQALYFHLSMRADDEGFVNNPKKIQRMIGASDDDIKLLIMKRFIIAFESGVVVIKHWRIHNYIRSDRFKETAYQDEKAQIVLKDNNVYTERAALGMTSGIPNDDQRLTQDRIGKVSIGKDNNNIKEPKRFVPPSLEEVSEYCKERNNNVDPARFIDFYTSKGWLVGKNKMKDWKAAVRTWERSGYSGADTKRGANGVKIDNRQSDTLDGIL